MLPDFGPRLEPFKGQSADANLPGLMIANTCHLICPELSGLANLRLSYAAAVISRYSSMTSCGVRYPSAE